MHFSPFLSPSSWTAGSEAAPATTRYFGSCFSSDVMQLLGKHNHLGSRSGGRRSSKVLLGTFPMKQRLSLWSLEQLLLSQHKGYLCMFITKIILQLLQAIICTWGNIMFVFSYCRDCTKAQWQRSEVFGMTIAGNRLRLWGLLKTALVKQCRS